MFNFVQTALIGKSTGANTGTTLPTIAVGDILFINGNTGAVLDAAAIAAVSDRTPVFAAMGVALGKPRLSAPLRRQELSRITRESFRAKVEQIDEIDTSALVAGKHYRLIVLLLDELRVIANRQTKLEISDFISSGVPATDAANLARLITKAKVTTGMIVGSVAAGNKVRVTGQLVPSDSVLDQYQFVAFKTVFHQLDEVSPSTSTGTPVSVVTVQKANGGSGLPAQVRQIELEASGNLGNTDLRNFDRLPNASFVDNSASYDIIHVLSFDKHQGDHEFTMESPVQTSFFTNSGSILSTFVETMLEAFKTKIAAPDISDNSVPDADNPGGM